MIKKILILTMIVVLAAIPFTFADTTQSVTPGATTNKYLQRGYGRTETAEIVAKLTNMNIDDVLKANLDGQSFYEIAKNKGITLEQYKTAMLEARLSLIDEKLKSGTITEATATELKEITKQKIQNCDGTNAKQFSKNRNGINNRGNNMRGRQQNQSCNGACL